MTEMKTPRQVEIDYQNTYFDYHIPKSKPTVFANTKTLNKVNVYRVTVCVWVGLFLSTLGVLFKVVDLLNITQ
jgi:hypothetical protein